LDKHLAHDLTVRILNREFVIDPYFWVNQKSDKGVAVSIENIFPDTSQGLLLVIGLRGFFQLLEHIFVLSLSGFAGGSQFFYEIMCFSVSSYCDLPVLLLQELSKFFPYSIRINGLCPGHWWFTSFDDIPSNSFLAISETISLDTFRSGNIQQCRFC
jgi:hypothetical protein